MASWTTPVTHATGDVLAVSDWNGVANNTTFLYQAPYAAYYNSVSTSLTNGTATQVTLGGTTASGYGFSVSLNNAVAPLAGTYWVAGQYGAAVAAGIGFTFVYKNGVQVLQGGGGPNEATTGFFLTTGLIKCNASDALGLYGYQTSGGSLGTLAQPYGTYLHAMFIGAQ